jgi:LytS/YehU family sensor histidine kinase
MWKNFLSNSLIFFVLWMGNGLLSGYFQRLVPWKDRPIQAFLANVGGTLVFTVVAFSLTMVLIRWLIYGESWVKSWEILGHLSYVFVILITLVISLFMHGRSFLLAWRTAELEAAQLKEANTASRYEVLKSQVNPHFLFNSLNVLSTLVYKDQDLAAKFIQQLSKVYRYVLDTRDKQVVTLEEEVEALKAYIFLMQIRFGEGMDVRFELPEEEGFVLPPLTLQMLIENVVKHNIITKSAPITIEILYQGNGALTIRNNLRKKELDGLSSGIGLDNIRDRYQYISDREVSVQDGPDYFTVEVPLLEMKPA